MVHTMTRSTRRRRLTAAVGTLIVTAAGTLLGAPAHAAPTAVTTLTVNANKPFRPVTHVASGGLYGLADDARPADDLVTPLHPNTFVQMAPGGTQLPNGEPEPAGDSLVVAPKAARAGARVVVRMPDWYPNFPYHWVSWEDWTAAVATQVNSVKASDATNIAAYELWNEPDFTWNTAAAGPFNEGWVKTFQEVRSMDPSRPIDGPSFTHWDPNLMRDFLTFAKAHNAVPEIVSWHELQTQQNIAAHVAAYRQLESSLDIRPRPISIEEYAAPSEVGVPGRLVGYVAKLERAGVADAELAFWNHYGTLGDTLVDTDGAPNGSYWLYKWYGDMSGQMVTTVPPAQTGIDGAASVSADGRRLSLIFGGGTGDSAVQVTGLNTLAALRGTVHVKVETTPSLGRTTPVPETSIRTISETDVRVDSGGKITIPVTTNAVDGYHVVITPGGSS